MQPPMVVAASAIIVTSRGILVVLFISASPVLRWVAANLTAASGLPRRAEPGGPPRRRGRCAPARDPRHLHADCARRDPGPGDPCVRSAASAFVLVLSWCPPVA